MRTVTGLAQKVTLAFHVVS